MGQEHLGEGAEEGQLPTFPRGTAAELERIGEPVSGAMLCGSRVVCRHHGCQYRISLPYGRIGFLIGASVARTSPELLWKMGSRRRIRPEMYVLATAVEEEMLLKVLETHFV